MHLARHRAGGLRLATQDQEPGSVRRHVEMHRIVINLEQLAFFDRGSADRRSA
jgi:hypothetical protein